MESRSSRRAVIEPMEPRTLLTATVNTAAVIQNVSQLVGPQQTETVSINPANPLDVYLVSNSNGSSLFTATSTNGGTTWTPKVQFTGADFPPALDGATCSFDQFGNLFVAYQRADTGNTEVLYSYDVGQTFHVLASLPGIQSLPTIATGDGMVWLSLQQSKLTGNPKSVENSGAVAYVAKVTGLGRIGKLSRVQSVSGVNSDIESIAVGPAGQVALAYQYATEVGPSVVYTESDSNGLSGSFGAVNSQNFTEVGTADQIPPMTTAGITAGASMAYDTSSDAFTGRLYMAYVSAPDPSNQNTNIYLVFSDNDGVTWSQPVRVNDDTTANSHFMPQVAVDPVTGSVAVTWYDSRNDNGIPGTGGTDNIADDDVQVYGAVGSATESGVNFSSNFVVQPAYSNANDILLTDGAPNPDQFGLHNGLSLYNGNLIATWADNSDSTGNNLNGLLADANVYTGKMTVTTTPTPATSTLAGVFGAGHPSLTYTESDGTKVTFQLSSGHGYLFVDTGGGLHLRIDGTTAASALTITARNGSKSVSLADAVVNGSLGRISAPTTTITGAFSVSGQVVSSQIGSVNGGYFATAGNSGKLTFGSLTNAKVLAGASAGADLIFGTSDDVFAPGSIGSLTVTGAITTSFIGAGVNPVDGVFGNGNDTNAETTPSSIGNIRAGSVDASTIFEAATFSRATIPGTVDPATDPHFITL